MIDILAGGFVLFFLSFILAPGVYKFFNEFYVRIEYWECWQIGNLYMVLIIGFGATAYHLLH